MTRILVIFATVLWLGSSAQAQTESQDLQIEMDQMMEQMQQMMKGFGMWMEDAPIFMDTTIVREFHFPAEELDGMMDNFPMDGLTNMMFQFSPDSLMNSEMFRGMEEMMEQWSHQGMNGMEDLLRDMEKMMPEQDDLQVPSDPNAPDGKTKKKKRKTTVL